MIRQENDRQNYPYENHYHEDDISLIDLLRVIWKWKWLIIAGVVICVVAAAVISFRMPNVYEVSMFIEPGVVGISADGSFLYGDSPGNISSKISEGVYNRKLEEMFSKEQLKNHLKFKSAPVKGANVIKISSRWNEGRTDLGIKVSRQLLDLLTEEYENVVQPMRNNYEKQIKLKLNSVKNTQNELKLKRAMLMNVKQRKVELLGEIQRVEDNMHKAVQQRDSYKKSDSDGSSFLILHSMAIQQNVVYSQLKYQIFDLEIREKDIAAESMNLKKDIDDVMAEMNELQYENGLIGNIKIIQQPEVSPNPIAPKKKQIIILAGVASLFMFIFIVFFIEYVRNAIRVRRNTQDDVVEE